MTDIEKIYTELCESDIEVLNITASNIKAVSMCDEDGDRSVGINEKQFESCEELKSALLHEQGHCEKYAFYNKATPYEVRSRLEYRADKYVAENVITKHDIDKAHKSDGLTEVWEFAEYFGVTVEYMKRIMNIHFHMEFME